MKKKSVSILLSAVMAASLLSGIGVSAESSEPVKLKALAILHPVRTQGYSGYAVGSGNGRGSER